MLVRPEGSRTPVAAASVTALAVGLTVLLSGCTPSEATDADPGHSLTWGVFVPQGGTHRHDLEEVQTMTGRAPDHVVYFASLEQDVPTAVLDRISEGGATPILSLEPWVPDAGPSQPAYALARINAGDHDPELQRWAESLAAWGKSVLLRFGHEMNGDWYPWAVGVNGNTAGDYIAAWNRMHDAFDAAGADNVSFVWAPNVPHVNSTVDFASVYPGPDRVDVFGIDGYNMIGNGSPWRSPQELFGAGLDELRALDGDQPILVTETASSEGARSGADKAQWITSLTGYLSHEDRVTGFIWFNAKKEQDWRINSTRESEIALRDALARLPQGE